jgi:hypothetical protein
MSSQSNTLNLYDAVDGSKRYYQRVHSDQVEINSAVLPMNLKASQINFLNSDGQFVTDVVSRVKAIDVAIALEITNRVAAVGTEEASREAADVAFSTELNVERVARIAADSLEKTDRLAADVVLQNAINAEAGARSGAVTAEQTARSSADGTLQFNIYEEKTARVAADLLLSNRINTATLNNQNALTFALVN